MAGPRPWALGMSRRVVIAPSVTLAGMGMYGVPTSSTDWPGDPLPAAGTTRDDVD